MSREQLGCVIMASGLGTRFGGNKLMADLNGRPLLAWVLDATKGVFDRRVVVTRHGDVAGLCRDWKVETVLHDLPSRSDTIRLGLEALGEGLDGCLFCPGDQPLLRRESVRAMALAAAREPGFIWRLAWAGVPGAPVLFPRWTFGELRSLPPGMGGSAVVQKYPGQVRMVPAQDAAELMDADRPEALERLRLLAGGERRS